MSHRPYHNLKQMSHWMRQIFVTVIQLDIVVIKSREKSQISLNTLWNRIFYAAIRRPVRHMYHAPNSKNLSSSRANALAIRTSWLVWYSLVTLSLVELYLHLTLLLENRDWKNGSMISGLLLQRGYVLPLCKCLFPGAFLLLKVTCPVLFRIILPRSNRMNTIQQLLNIDFRVYMFEPLTVR